MSRSARRTRAREQRRRLLVALGASALGVGTIAAVGLVLDAGDGDPRTGRAATTSTTGTVVTTTTTTRPSTDPVRLDSLPQPTSAEATGQALARIEAGLRSDNRDAAHLKQLGREQQMAYRALSNNPDWVTPALALVPAHLKAAVQANLDAGSALSNLTGKAPSGFPDWKILAPPPPETLRTYYLEAQQASGIPWQYLASIHFVETRIGRIHGNSSAGAQGPMQFLPTTWAEFSKGDIYDNHEAILAAGRFLAARGGASNLDRALFAYNPDTRYVKAIKTYAEVMVADGRAYEGYYQWQVFYATVDGSFLLPEGYGGPR